MGKNSTYWQMLTEQPDRVQSDINKLLEKYKVQPVGNRYIDLIVDRNLAPALVQELAHLPVAISWITWWCLCTPQSQASLGCPHGMGGPPNRFGEGWFSENAGPNMIISDRFQRNDGHAANTAEVHQVASFLVDYLTHTLPQESWFHPCLHPALWLDVPQEWQRKKSPLG